MVAREALLARVSAADGNTEIVPVTGAGDVGDALVRDKRVGKIMFTGSVKTGMKVVEASAGNLSRLTLELGGNDAGIVLPDVDPEAIAEGVFWGSFINNGQTCAALKRLYVPDAIYDQVVDALAAFTAKIPMGVGLDGLKSVAVPQVISG
jgi:phenylacetaldehyde dehydrogenase